MPLFLTSLKVLLSHGSMCFLCKGCERESAADAATAKHQNKAQLQDPEVFRTIAIVRIAKNILLRQFTIYIPCHAGYCKKSEQSTAPRNHRFLKLLGINMLRMTKKHLTKALVFYNLNSRLC